MIILIIHIVVSYDQNILLFMWKMDPMSGFDIRLVFTLPPSNSTLQYKRCIHLWNNFPCIKSLVGGKVCLCYFKKSLVLNKAIHLEIKCFLFYLTNWIIIFLFGILKITFLHLTQKTFGFFSLFYTWTSISCYVRFSLQFKV